MIVWLLFERYRRQRAELSAQSRLMEVLHLNRTAAAGALSASIAHEINQPLAAIRSNAEAAHLLLAATPPDIEEVKQILLDIQDADQRAADIMQHLRNLLKPRSGPDLVKFDLNEIVASSVHILMPEVKKRNISLTIMTPEQPLPITADRIHIQQVMLNLVTNGMDAMADIGTNERRIKIDTALTDSSEVEVSVRDSGPGIPPAGTDIFKAFYTTKPQGTGLGLSITRTIVETYGGKVWAENQSAGGAVFRFRLPLAA